jgi:hypothetical protein
MGFKVSDAERAKRQIDQLKEHLEGPLGNLPNFEGRLKKKSVGGSEFLVLELDGKMIDIPWHQFEQEQGEYEKLKTKLENLKAVICIGVRENYLLFAIEPSTDVLAKLGSGKSLAEVKELEPLAKFADKKLVSVSYSSKQFIETLNNADQQIENTINLLKQALSQAGLSEEAEERIGQDLNEVADDLKGVLPKPGAMTQFSFLTNRGVESYGHDWGENKYLDGSKPLPLLDHVGGNPLLAYVARGKYSPEQYEILRKWAKKGFGYFEEFGVPQMDEAGQETFKKFKEIGTPLVDRLDKATSQLLIPSMADGQSALVLDAKLVSSKWFEGMRQNEQSLPMIEVAMVLGVSDAGQLKKAIDEYKSILEDLIAKLKQEEPDLIPPNFKLPSPQTREVKTAAGTGTVYYYKLPEQAGVDAQLTPNAGLSDRVAVLSVSPKQSERILKDAPLQVISGGPLSDRSKPMATAMYFNNAELIDKLTPWAEFAVKQVVGAMQAAGAEEGDEDAKPAATGDDPMTKSYIEQVHTVMDLLKCIRTYESATYPEGGAMVTHSVTEIKDVP